MRSSQLSSLSEEHHDGLIFVSRLRLGLDKTPREVLREYTLWYWSHHIKPHFFQEEKILTRYLGDAESLVRRLKDEHSYIRELILEIDGGADKHHYKMLCDLLEDHIRFEEEDVFNFLEVHLDEMELDQLSMELNKHPLGKLEWHSNFWD